MILRRTSELSNHISSPSTKANKIWHIDGSKAEQRSGVGIYEVQKVKNLNKSRDTFNNIFGRNNIHCKLHKRTFVTRYTKL